jgi:hypothetical protein
MTDRLSTEGRRRNMQAIGPWDTKIELRLRHALWGQGIRGYRVVVRNVTAHRGPTRTSGKERSNATPRETGATQPSCEDKIGW